ncbi:MAG: tRNA pseudouridine(38-40) synthase TruA [Oscillospiraceae bacterium]|nr:tRNA pseudouridine(38-40) synthase TruA [Oscillospiraceae bacterium]
MRNIRLDICYDGTRYKGWQRLSGVSNTVQGKLEQTLSRILGEDIEISGSGRTDAGAHAKGQVANFHTGSDMSCRDILSALRRYLPEDIGIYSCREVSDRFHARLNARTKTYAYRIWNSDAPCVFDRRFVYVLPEKLDVEKMQQAAKHFLGEHDFSAFNANKKLKKTTLRRIDSLQICREGEALRFTVTGDGFLYNMVRILVGTLVEVGQGKRDADSIPALFGAKREDAGYLVPAQGLCLMEVSY